MRHLTAIALLLAMSAPLPAEEDAQTTPSPLEQAFAILHGEADQSQQNQPVEADMDVEVVEVFTAENAEELEAAFADGYPPPWLAQILNDETIPEEDRYWLDCRMRAVIAQDLHLFFDRAGNPVRVDADWIRYGEYYWQEHFIVNPPGEVPEGEKNPATNLWGETGYVYNRFGERTGELALCEDWMYLSRDGSVGLLPHRGSEVVHEYGPAYLYLVYDDGTYYKYPESLGTYDYALSQSGDYAVLVERAQNRPDPVIMFSRDGQILWEREAIGRTVTNFKPAILPGDSICLVPSIILPSDKPGRTEIFKCDSGELLDRIPAMSTWYDYTADGHHMIIGGRICYSIPDGRVLWEGREFSNLRYSIKGQMACSNNLRILGAVADEGGDPYPEIALALTENGRILSEMDASGNQRPVISSNGAFYILVCDPQINYQRSLSPTPLSVWTIGGDR